MYIWGVKCFFLGSQLAAKAKRHGPSSIFFSGLKQRLGLELEHLRHESLLTCHVNTWMWRISLQRPHPGHLIYDRQHLFFHVYIFFVCFCNEYVHITSELFRVLLVVQMALVCVSDAPLQKGFLLIHWESSRQWLTSSCPSTQNGRKGEFPRSWTLSNSALANATI